MSYCNFCFYWTSLEWAKMYGSLKRQFNKVSARQKFFGFRSEVLQEHAKNARGVNARGLLLVSYSWSRSQLGLCVLLAWPTTEAGDVTCDKNLPRLPATADAAAAGLQKWWMCQCFWPAGWESLLLCPPARLPDYPVSVVSTSAGYTRAKLLSQCVNAVGLQLSVAAVKLQQFLVY